jgi:hypothetical protein
MICGVSVAGCFACQPDARIRKSARAEGAGPLAARNHDLGTRGIQFVVKDEGCVCVMKPHRTGVLAAHTAEQQVVILGFRYGHVTEARVDSRITLTRPVALVVCARSAS